MRSRLAWHTFLAVAGALAPCVVRAQLAGGGSAPDIDLVRVALALALCLGIGVAVLWWLRRFGGARFGTLLPKEDQRRLRIVETARLHVRATLYVVEFDGRRILIAADQNGVVRLAEGGSSQEATQ